MLSRLEFIASLAAAAGLTQEPRSRLTARVARPTRSVTPGVHELGIGRERDGLLRVPDGYDPARPWPLLVALHGAGGSAAGPVRNLGAAAGLFGIILLSLDSRNTGTWDAIRGDYGADVAFMDLALRHVFERCSIDPARVWLEGFSDGASYALGVGIANGLLFRRIVAFSPGFVPPGTPVVGAPKVFISHGTNDEILPINRTSRRIVPELRRTHDVTYVEFDGGHGFPPEIVTRAMNWLNA